MWDKLGREKGKEQKIVDIHKHTVRVSKQVYKAARTLI